MFTGTVLPYSEYRKLPPDDPNKYEMLWGELHVSPSPVFNHQLTQINLAALLQNHVKAHGLGRILAPIDLYRDEVNYTQPDISFFTTEQVRQLRGTQAIHLAPPLIAEILSPSTEKTDRGDKRRWYAEIGVQEYWLVDLSTGAVEVIDLRSGEVQREDPVRSRVLPGLTIPLAEIFE